MGFIILLHLIMASGATQEVKLPEPYATMAVCEAAKADAAKKYSEEHPDTKVEKAECIAG